MARGERVNKDNLNFEFQKINKQWGGPKMAEEQDGETTFSPTNSSKDHLNAEQLPQNNF